jgi:hypothetical protein
MVPIALHKVKPWLLMVPIALHKVKPSLKVVVTVSSNATAL